MIIHFARHTVRISAVLIGIILIVLALFTLGARVALPVAANYKSGIESRVSDYLNSPVDIGDLSFKWEGFGPVLMATDVAVIESDERVVTLDQLLIDINLAKSLMRREPIINELSLVGANLAIEADSAGQIRLHGMKAVNTHSVTDVSTTDKAKGPGVDLAGWLLNARKVGLLDSTISLIDRGSDHTLVVKDLTILAENDGDIHQLRVDMTLPDELGGKLHAGIDLIGNARSLATSDGKVFVSGENLRFQALVDLARYAGLATSASARSMHLDTDVSAELWGEWNAGQLISLRGPVRSSAIVDTRSGQTVLDEFSTSINHEREADNSRLTLSDITGRVAQDSFAVDQLTAGWSNSRADVWSVQTNGQGLDLQSGIQLPVALLEYVHPEMASKLKSAAPTGVVSDWLINVRNDGYRPLIDASINLDSLSIQAVEGLPGFGPVKADIAIVESIGAATFNAEQMQVQWSLLNDQVNVMDLFSGTFEIDVRDQLRPVTHAKLRLLDDGIELDTRIKAAFAPGKSPHLDVQSRYAASDVSALKQWLPRAVLPASTQRWIDRAILRGKASDGSLLFFGHLADFPFDEGQGVFRSSVNIAEGELAFLPDWPIAKEIGGTLDLDGLTITGNASASRVESFDISSTRVRIANLLAPVLEIQGTGSGELQQMIDFGVEGPLRDFLGPALSDIDADGKAQMDIAMEIPLYRKPSQEQSELSALNPRKQRAVQRSIANWVPFSVSGSVFLSDNGVRIGKADMDFANTTGSVGFDLGGIRVNSMRANMLGQRVLVDAQTTGNGQNASTVIALQGALEANDLLAHYGNTLDQFLSGASQWNVSVSVPHSAQKIAQNGVVLTASSDLVGTEINVPVPFYKSTGKAAPFTMVTSFREPEDVQLWDISYGSEFHAHAASESGTLQSLLIALQGEEITKTQLEDLQPGIRLHGNVDALSVDGWVQTIAQYIDSLPAGDAGPQKILPISAALNVKSLMIGSQSLGSARLQSNTDDTFLNMVISNQALTGNLRYPRRHWARDTALKARINHIDWSVFDALANLSTETSDGGDDDELDPRLLPPVEARITKMTHGKVALKDIVIRAQADVSGLEISTLGFAYQTMRLVGRGYWHLRDPQSVNSQLSGKHVTHLNMVLQSDDFGAGLEEIGLNDIILDGQGNIDATLSWAGPAYKPSIDKLVGNVSALMESGSVIPFEPGAGRVVGLFALQALPRRLNLDFKDITEDGLAFKRITGDVEIGSGIADVKLVQLTGPIGVVDITGQSDLNKREFDQKVTVLPRVSAALPIIGAISGGASAGIGVFVAAGFLKVLGLDFDRIGLRDYSLTGPWDEPVFKPLENAEP